MSKFTQSCRDHFRSTALTREQQIRYLHRQLDKDSLQSSDRRWANWYIHSLQSGPSFRRLIAGSRRGRLPKQLNDRVEFVTQLKSMTATIEESYVR